MKPSMHTPLPAGKRNVTDFESVLAMTIRKLPKDQLQEIILGLVQRNPLLQAELIARLVPLSMEETMGLIQDVVTHAAHGETFLGTVSQEAIRSITDALIDRAKAFIFLQEPMQAAETCFAILLIIEPLIVHVSDEGVVLQQVITQAFDVLRSLSEQAHNPDVIHLLASRADSILQTIPADNLHYEACWKDVIKGFQEYDQRG